MREFRPVDARRLLGTGPAVILEIGANDGEDTLKFTQAFNHRRTRVFSFECDPRAIERWKKNVKDPRVFLVEAAASNETGFMPFNQSSGQAPGWAKYGDWDKSGSLLQNDKHTDNAKWMSFKEPIKVKTITLDDWTSKTLPGTIIDFCWVDVQGAELLVIQGGLETLRRVRYWYCECDPRPNYKGQATIDDLKEILEENGFEYQGEYGGYNHLWKNKNVSVGEVSEQVPTVQQATYAAPVKSPVSVRFIGQFGNQLFQYVAGKIAAEITGLAFCPPPTFLTKSGNPVTWTDIPLFVMEASGGAETKPGSPMTYSGEHWIDWEQYKDASKLSLRSGYFQRYECIKPWKDKIKDQWLKIQKPFVNPDPDAVHIHCRRADYVPGVGNPNDPSRHGISTTLDEYMACLDHFPDAKRLVIYTDDIKDPWLQEFRKLRYPWTISGGSWDQDFLALASCKWLIIAQSTFSWWAGFLGIAEKIACPMSPGTLWHYGKDLKGAVNGRDYPNLIVDDEPDRWTWVEPIEE